MILDSSALVGIALDEPLRPMLVAKINAAERVGVGAPTLVEAGIVLAARTGEDGAKILADLIEACGALILEFGPVHWMEAISAWQRFGRTRHSASLNFGDCLAYAAARVAGDSLLAIGNDFVQTDIALA